MRTFHLGLLVVFGRVWQRITTRYCGRLLQTSRGSRWIKAAQEEGDPGDSWWNSERFGKIRKKLNLSDISRHLQIPRVAHSSHIRLTCRMFWAVLSRFVVRAHSKEASLPFANSLGIRHAVRFVIVPRYRSHGLNSEVIYLMSTHPFESHCGMLYRMLFGWHERSAFLCKRCVRADESNIPARC